MNHREIFDELNDLGYDANDDRPVAVLRRDEAIDEWLRHNGPPRAEKVA